MQWHAVTNGPGAPCPGCVSSEGGQPRRAGVAVWGSGTGQLPETVKPFFFMSATTLCWIASNAPDSEVLFVTALPMTSSYAEYAVETSGPQVAEAEEAAAALATEAKSVAEGRNVGAAMLACASVSAG